MVKLTTLLVTLPYGLDTTTSYAPAFPKPTSFNTSVGPGNDYFADDVVTRIRNEQVAGGVHRHAEGSIQFRIGRRAPVAGVACSCPVARHRGDNPVGVHLADALLPVSAMNRLPVASTATPEGPVNSALVAAPPSPE